MRGTSARSRTRARSASTDPAHTTAFWAPAIGYLHSHLSVSYRVEAVDTAEHWAAAYLPDAGIPIVRGWYRQSDFPQNEILYDPKLGPIAYEDWLRSQGVRYVLLSDAPPDYSARNEAALIRSGRTALVPVFRSAHVTVYELPNATPHHHRPGRPERRVDVADAHRRARRQARAATASAFAGRRTGTRPAAASGRARTGRCACSPARRATST